MPFKPRPARALSRGKAGEIRVELVRVVDEACSVIPSRARSRPERIEIVRVIDVGLDRPSGSGERARQEEISKPNGHGRARKRARRVASGAGDRRTGKRTTGYGADDRESLAHFSFRKARPLHGEHRYIVPRARERARFTQDARVARFCISEQHAVANLHRPSSVEDTKRCGIVSAPTTRLIGALIIAIRCDILAFARRTASYRTVRALEVGALPPDRNGYG
jgi:hypothetical protein